MTRLAWTPHSLAMRKSCDAARIWIPRGMRFRNQTIAASTTRVSATVRIWSKGIRSPPSDATPVRASAKTKGFGREPMVIRTRFCTR